MVHAGRFGRAELLELATDAGLAHAAEPAEQEARWGIRLEAAARVPVTGGSKVGGLPDLARGLDWPVARGTRCVFLAQVAVDDIPRLDPGLMAGVARAALISFFAFQHRGTFEVTGGAVLVAPVGAELRRVAAPGPSARVLARERALRMRPVLSLPALGADGDHARRRLHLRHGDRLKYLRLLAALEHAQAVVPPRHQLIGHPDRIRDDLLAEAAALDALAEEAELPSADELELRAERWRVLLRFDSDRSIRWPSGGTVAFCIPAAALAAGRYDEARAFSWAPAPDPAILDRAWGA